MLNTEWPIGNILHQIRTHTTNAVINCLYMRNNSLFDNILHELKNICIYDKFTLDNQKNMSCFYYDYLLSNSVFVESKEINQIDKTHLKLAIINHDDLSLTKKEDLHIINSNLQNAIVINLNKNSNGIIKNAHNINYGLPESDPVKKVKDLLIINQDNNNVLTQIHNNINNGIATSDIITEFGNRPLKEITNVIGQYKVILNMTSRINTILALSCKTNVISGIKTNEQDPEHDMLINPDDFDSIYDCINYAINKTEPNNEQIIKTYSLASFSQNIENILKDRT